MSTERRSRKRSQADASDIVNTKLMLKRHCMRKKMQPITIFISQEHFNQIIRQGTIEEVFKAIEAYPEMVIGIDREGSCPLMSVADRHFRHADDADALVAKLISTGAKMHSGCFFSATPLYYAAARSPLALQALVKYETSWGSYVGNVVTPWRVALYTSEANFEIMMPYIPEAAVSFRNYLGQSLLIEVVLQRPMLVIKMLAHAHFRTLIDEPDMYGETPLAHAARILFNRDEAVDALLRCGADLLYTKDGRKIYYSDARNMRGTTPRSAIAVSYVRERLSNGFDHSPFAMRYKTWYK